MDHPVWMLRTSLIVLEYAIKIVGFSCNLWRNSWVHYILVGSEALEASNEISDEYAGVTIILVTASLLIGLGEAFNPLIYTYIDDNVQRSKVPIMMTFARFVEQLYPLFSIWASYIFLNIYVSPTLTPIFGSTDPRWIGAWWMGWFTFSALVMIFVPITGNI